MKILLVSFFVVIVDQLSKLFVKGVNIPGLKMGFAGLQSGNSIPIIDHVFSISLVENPGIAFGIDFGSNFKLFISIFTLIASLALLYYILQNKEKEIGLRISLALILGGAIGNLIDRIFYGVLYHYAPIFHGKVVDFFDLRMFNLFIFNHTFGNYVFNFADVSVTAGVILLLFALNKQKIVSSNSAKEIEIVLTEK